MSRKTVKLGSDRIDKLLPVRHAAIGTGEMDVVTGAVETITGRPPPELESFLSDNPERHNPELWEKGTGID